MPIALASRVLNNSKKYFSPIEKELLSIVCDISKFRPYLYRTKFIIRTDHKPLVWLKNCNIPSSRLLRCRLQLDDCNYIIEYKSSETYSNACASSQIYLNNNDESANNKIFEITRSSIKKMVDNLLNSMYSEPCNSSSTDIINQQIL